MLSKALAPTIVLVVLGACLNVGCKSQEERVCDHLIELAAALDNGPEIAVEKCHEELAEMRAECSNPGDVLDCFLEQEHLASVHDCRAVCERSEGE